MSRQFIAVSLAITGTACAQWASAATLTVLSDKTEYAVGDTIVLTVTGDAEGASELGIYGQLGYSAALTQTVLSTQTAHTTGGVPWIQGALLYGDGYASTFNQIAPAVAQSSTPDQLQIATVILTAEAGGVVNVSWNLGGDGLYYFGLADAPGTSFSILGPPPVVQPPPVVESPPIEEPPAYPGPGSDPLPGPDPDPGYSGSPIPEPSAALVFAAGLIAARAATRRR